MAQMVRSNRCTLCGWLLSFQWIPTDGSLIIFLSYKTFINLSKEIKMYLFWKPAMWSVDYMNYIGIIEN